MMPRQIERPVGLWVIGTGIKLISCGDFMWAKKATNEELPLEEICSSSSSSAKEVVIITTLWAIIRLLQAWEEEPEEA